MKIMKLSDHATMPTSGSEDAAGYDLYATRDVCIHAGDTEMIDTGVCIEIPVGFFGGVYSRSGLSTKKGLAVINGVGVIDSDYRGSIKVPLHNHGNSRQWVKAGERIAQLVIQPYVKEEFEIVEELTETERGAGSFGSTGR